MNPSRTNKTGAILSLLILITLSGCATLGPDFQPPVVETPETYRFQTPSAEELTNLKWWELFDDPVLDTIVSMALANNKDLKIAASRIEEARAFLGFTKADAYPFLDIEAGGKAGNFAGTRSDTTNKSAYIAPVLSWEIDFWGKFRRSTEAAKAELMATEYARRTVQLGLISEVVSTYYFLLNFHQELDISRETLESRQASLSIVRKRLASGIVPEIDLNQAQIQKEIAAIAIPQFQRLIAKTESAMSILLGQLPGEIQKGKDLHSQTVPQEIPAGLPSSLLERRPDLAQAIYLLEAQTARIGVAESLKYPSISLTGLLGLASSEISSITSDGGIWSVGASLFGPIYNAGQNTRRVEIEEEKTKQALYIYENTVLLAFREVEDALVEISTYNEQFAAVERK